MTKNRNYMTKTQVHDQGIINAGLCRNCASMAMSGTGLWGLLSSPDELLCSPHEVGGRGVECVCKLRDLVDFDVTFCGENAHEGAYGDAGGFG